MIRRAADIIADVLGNSMHQTVADREVHQHSILATQCPEGEKAYYRRTMYGIQEEVARNVFFTDWANNGFRNILVEPKLSKIAAGIDSVMEERVLEDKEELESQGIKWTDEAYSKYHNISEKYFSNCLNEIFPRMLIYDALQDLCESGAENPRIRRWFPKTEGRDKLFSRIRQMMAGEKGKRLVELYFAMRENGQVKEIGDRENAEFFGLMKEICSTDIGTERNFSERLRSHSKESYPKGYIEGLAKELQQ